MNARPATNICYIFFLALFAVMLHAEPSHAAPVHERLQQAAISEAVVAAREAVVRDYIHYLNTGKPALKKLGELFSTHATVQDPAGTSPAVRGRKAIMDFYRDGPFLHPIRAHTDGEIRVAGDGAAFAFTAVSGSMRMNIIDVFTFDTDQKIIRMKAYWSAHNVHTTSNGPHNSQ